MILAGHYRIIVVFTPPLIAALFASARISLYKPRAEPPRKAASPPAAGMLAAR